MSPPRDRAAIAAADVEAALAALYEARGPMRARLEEARGWEMSQAETLEKTQELVDNGITVVEPSEELRTGFAEIGETIAAEWEESAGEDGTALLEAFRAN